MKVLVACEFSGVVRDAFRKRGHDAWSCDFLPTESVGQHIEGDCLTAIAERGPWDLMVAHPPCTHLAVSGAAWFEKKRHLQGPALQFVRDLMAAPIPHICIENPVSIISTEIREPDQIIHPWMFGHEMCKTTCLWLKNLPPLQAGKHVGKGEFHYTKSGIKITKWYADTFRLPAKIRGHARSVTFAGIAEAMADQWGTPPDPTSLDSLLWQTAHTFYPPSR